MLFFSLGLLQSLLKVSSLSLTSARLLAELQRAEDVLFSLLIQSALHMGQLTLALQCFMLVLDYCVQ